MTNIVGDIAGGLLEPLAEADRILADVIDKLGEGVQWAGEEVQNVSGKIDELAAKIEQIRAKLRGGQ